MLQFNGLASAITGAQPHDDPFSATYFSRHQCR
jgi:hypothetical protein